ncbi:hypothetical protein [Pseudobacteriovorax antillogorgiicola]|uniref:Cytochrome c domain-containing protein n=1 Tax=Pseudobacteriovorax antillogorgiicola TaxID=1513793 RepID=A0A1Y6CQ08_9BACT|nr:hypothetical protein [Pseudobacteriovorax antillogorgiicola]TCS46375.1 hypothetical protein EDD56_12439 [Pseudobacteriovorax antillogorgiicola]SMF68573.1 hypothetical protein SAMN06296036_12439 [Pseudobacteriovorax antillogorgiicola]
MNPRLSMLSIWLLSVAACSSKNTTTTSPRASSETTEDRSENSDSSNNTDQETDDQSQTDTSNEEVRLITESQARSIMEASCIAAGCHADVDEIFDSNTIVTQIESELMPPPDQGRYTLSDEKRAELLLFFSNRNGG